MSIKSTHFITREDALKIILEKLEKEESITNSHLEDILEEVIHNGFYNFSIVSKEDLEENKKDEYPHPYIEYGMYIPEYNDALKIMKNSLVYDYKLKLNNSTWYDEDEECIFSISKNDSKKELYTIISQCIAQSYKLYDGKPYIELNLIQYEFLNSVDCINKLHERKIKINISDTTDIIIKSEKYIANIKTLNLE